MQLTSLAPRPASIQSTTTVDDRPLDVRASGILAMHAKDMGKKSGPYLDSASGIVGVGGTAWIAADGQRQLVRYNDLAAPGALGPGLVKRDKKYDFEAITAVPVAGRHTGGSSMVAFASGSAPDRGVALLQDVDATGNAVGASRHVDLAPLYAALGAQLGGARLNIEGAAFRQAADGLELLLFQREHTADGRSTIFRIDGAAFLDAARAGRPVAADALRGAAHLTLGQRDGVPLGFSDAKVLPDGRIAFTATGERIASDGRDGEIVGSAFGILNADLTLTSLRSMTGPIRKVEGIELASALDPAAPANRFVAITDGDDPAVPSEVIAFDA